MKIQELYKVSDPQIVYKKFLHYYPPESHIEVSNRKGSKYMVFNPHTQKYVHFGSIYYSDFTRHKDKDRRNRYLKRASKIKGNWKDDIYSANILSIILTWDGFDYLVENRII